MAETGSIRGNRKVRKGTVVSKSGDKSAVVRTERRERHPLYGKVVRRFKKYHAHDEDNSAAVGDEVTIVETRPLSATKRWRIVKGKEK
jgi:small subunit ribosomal protein S17